MSQRPTQTPITNPDPAEIAVHVLHTGSVYIDRALAFRERTLNPVAFTGWLRPASKKVWVPVSAYLIEHPDGLVLVDTGWHADMRTAQRSHLGWIPSTMFKGDLPEGEAVHEQLAAMDVSPADLAYVVLTHLDSDHVSGLAHVADAGEIVVSEPEWAARGQFRYIPSMWEGVAITPVALESIPYGPFDEGIDLFDDGRIYLVSTPGHSAGQVSVLVDTGAGWVLLASDVGYAARSWQEGLLPGLTDDVAEAEASLAWVGEFAARDDCLAAIANHDPEVDAGEIVGG